MLNSNAFTAPMKRYIFLAMSRVWTLLFLAVSMLSIQMHSSTAAVITPPAGTGTLTSSTTYPTLATCWTTTIVVYPTPRPTSGVALWWQCGGLGYAGPDICAPGGQCVAINHYYFQCQPDPVTTTLVACT
ncbi:hypothetical protein B0H34DRAFT_180359 [Crassisporium funariophilum]|nr:hypothetical protein B0H34DRAFT_180359 [Crassisporium funariophilum]